MEIIFATSNASKVKIARERLERYGINVIQRSVETSEIQSLDVEEVGMEKARQLLGKLQEPFFIDDSGFTIYALNGFPGALIKPTIDAIGDSGILKLMEGKKDRKVNAESVLVYANPKTNELKSFIGTFEGTLSESLSGENIRGLGIERIFIPLNSTKTIASMSDDEWLKSLDDFRKTDHYDKFGRWITSLSK